MNSQKKFAKEKEVKTRINYEKDKESNRTSKSSEH